jgi:hypothetical protein
VMAIVKVASATGQAKTTRFNLTRACGSTHTHRTERLNQSGRI